MKLDSSTLQVLTYLYVHGEAARGQASLPNKFSSTYHNYSNSIIMLDWSHHKFLKLNFLRKFNRTLHKNHNM